MLNIYKTIFDFGESETEIKKSKFIGYAKPIYTEEEALDFIQNIKEKHKSATHNVWAYTLGLDMNIQRYSDDGEPKGSAGIPTLEVIKKEEIKNVVVVVTRYFGGIKLGASGLIRAYTEGAKIGLHSAKIISKIPHKRFKITLDYNLIGKAENEFRNKNIIIREILYTDSVTFILFLKLEEINSTKEFCLEISNGNAIIIEDEEFYLSLFEDEFLDIDKF